MPIRTNEFQQLIHLIEFQLSPHDAHVEESVEFVDKVTGKKREVDVVITRKTGIHNFTFGIECIDHARPADSTWVEKIIAKHKDIEVDKTILVSRSGFYKPALEKAHYNDFETITLNEAKDSDWNTYTQNLTSLSSIAVGISHFTIKEVMPLAVSSDNPTDQPSLISSPPETTFITDRDETDRIPLNSVVEHIVNSTVKQDDFQAHILGIAKPEVTTPFEFKIRIGDEIYTQDQEGNKKRLTQILLRGECIEKLSTISLSRAKYGEAPILHGSTHHMGHKVDVSATEFKDGTVTLASRVQWPPKKNL